MRGTTPAIGIIALILLPAVTGCAIHNPYQPFDSIEHLKEQEARRLGAERAAAVEIPFALSDELKAEAAGRLSRAGSERWRVQQMQDFIFGWLDLRYELMPTRTASGTYESRAGNCLSFVNLFVGLGREQHMAPFYVEVEDYQRWSYQEGTVVSHGHIVAGMYIDGELSTFDFLPYRTKSYRKFKPIDDLKATAHYYNNLGAESLISGDLEHARGLLQMAVDLAPSFDKAINNLGVSLLRLGEVREAVELYERGLEKHSENVAMLTNLARGYQQLGQEDRALELLNQVEALDDANPFIFVYRGELALAEGDYQKALEYMVKALRRDTELPEVHLGLVKVYVALGDLQRARHHLERTLKLDATHIEARKYATMLDGLAQGGHG